LTCGAIWAGALFGFRRLFRVVRVIGEHRGRERERGGNGCHGNLFHGVSPFISLKSLFNDDLKCLESVDWSL
jgi:hypothetical protein